MPSVLRTVALICKITQFFNEIEVYVFWEYIPLLKTGSHESITVLLMQGLCSFLNIYIYIFFITFPSYNN